MNAQATVLFIPHGGGPLPLLQEPGHAGLNRFLRGWPDAIRRPDAIVVISAHWEESVVSITAAERPDMLFDYYGFPPETYAYEYPAPGDPGLAESIREMLRQADIEARLDYGRGFDHGLFVPLMLMYPQADIPCIQVSLLASLDAAEHIRVGRALAGLKNRNLLILGSGFSFHNLQVMMKKRDQTSDTRNLEFETWLAQSLSDPLLGEGERETRLTAWLDAPHARYCHPREEHLLPLQVCYGIARSPAKKVFQEAVAGFVASAYEWRAG